MDSGKIDGFRREQIIQVRKDEFRREQMIQLRTDRFRWEQMSSGENR